MQMQYNKEHGIRYACVTKSVWKEMLSAAEELDFEMASNLWSRIEKDEEKDLGDDEDCKNVASES